MSCFLKVAKDYDLPVGTLKNVDRRVRAADLATDQSVEDVLIQVERDLAEEKLIADYNRVQDEIAQNNLYQQIMSSKFAAKGEWGNAINSVLVGGESMDRRSIAGLADALEAQFLGYRWEIRKQVGTEGEQIYLSGESDKQIRRAMWHYEHDEEPPADFGKTVNGIAKVLVNNNQRMLKSMQEAGASVRELSGYFHVQSHNMDKIRDAGKDQWIADVTQLLDIKRTFGFTYEQFKASAELQAQVKDILSDLYDQFARGDHYLSVNKDGTVSGVINGSSLNASKGISNDRFLHFWGADRFDEYQSKYGAETLKDAYEATIGKSSRSIAQLRLAGPRWLDNIKIARDRIIAENPEDFKLIDNIKQAETTFDRNVKNVTNEVNVAGRGIAASVFAGFRSLNSFSKLGGSVIASITDSLHVASEMSMQGGAPQWWSGFIGYWKQQLTFFKDTAEKRAFASSLGFTIDSFRYNMLNRYHPEDLAPGSLSGKVKLGQNERIMDNLRQGVDWLSDRTQRFSRGAMKYTGLGAATDNARIAFAIGISRMLGDFSGKSFDKLPKNMQYQLEVNGIGVHEWNAISKGVERVQLGQSEDFIGLTVEGVQALSDDVIDTFILNRFPDVGEISPQRRQIARQELESKLLTYLSDSMKSAVLEPKANVKSAMNWGIQRGTLRGELLRSFMQFKSFNFAFVMQRVVRRHRMAKEQSGREYNMRYVKDTLPHMAASMVALTGMGVIVEAIKDISKNREPKSWAEFDTWKSAFITGGAGSYLGDLLMGELEPKWGSGPGDYILGPGAQQVGDAAKLLGLPFSAAFGEGLKGNKALGEALTLAYNNLVPNLFYTKAATDYLFYGLLMESLQPGRMEEKLSNASYEQLVEY